MQADGQIIPGDRELRRKSVQRFAIEIGALNEIGVFRLQGGKQLPETGADGAFGFGIRRDVGFHRESIDGVAMRAAPAMEVDNRVAQDAIKPRAGILTGSQRAFGVQRL